MGLEGLGLSLGLKVVLGMVMGMGMGMVSLFERLSVFDTRVC